MFDKVIVTVSNKSQVKHIHSINQDIITVTAEHGSGNSIRKVIGQFNNPDERILVINAGGISSKMLQYNIINRCNMLLNNGQTLLEYTIEHCDIDDNCRGLLIVPADTICDIEVTENVPTIFTQKCDDHSIAKNSGVITIDDKYHYKDVNLKHDIDYDVFCGAIYLPWNNVNLFNYFDYSNNIDLYCDIITSRYNKFKIERTLELYQHFDTNDDYIKYRCKRKPYINWSGSNCTLIESVIDNSVVENSCLTRCIVIDSDLHNVDYHRLLIYKNEILGVLLSKRDY